MMVDIAEHNNGEYIKLMDIASRQSISEKYLEGILASMTKSGILIGMRGKGGGYKLAVPAERCTVGDVLRAAEGSLSPVACIETTPNYCPNSSSCKTLAVWEGLNKVINDYLDSITVAELAGYDGADEYCI